MNDRLKSRKFLFTLFWNSLVLMGMITTLVISKELSYMGQIITFAGTITVSYIAVQGYKDIKKGD